MAAVLLVDDRARASAAGRPSSRGTGGSPAASSTAPRTRLGVGGRDRGRLERAEPVQDLRRPAERVLHRELLVEHHAHQQRERAVGEHLVGGASPVMWKVMAPSCPTHAHACRLLRRTSERAGRGLRLDREHRARGVEQDALRVAAEDQLADGRAPAQADDDQVGVARSAMPTRSSAGSKPRTSWRTSYLTPGLARARPRARRGRSSDSAERLAVELTPTAVGVHHDQLGAAELRLVDALARAPPPLGLGHVAHDHGLPWTPPPRLRRPRPRPSGNRIPRLAARRWACGGRPAVGAGSGRLTGCRCCAPRSSPPAAGAAPRRRCSRSPTRRPSATRAGDPARGRAGRRERTTVADDPGWDHGLRTEIVGAMLASPPGPAPGCG